MSNLSFPKITTVVQAKPWAEGHIARVITVRKKCNSEYAKCIEIGTIK